MTKLVCGLGLFVVVGLLPGALRAQETPTKGFVSLRAELPEGCADDVEFELSRVPQARI